MRGSVFWTSSNHLHLLPVKRNPTYEDHYRRKHMQIIAWMKISDECVAGLDRWIAGCYC